MRALSEQSPKMFSSLVRFFNPVKTSNPLNQFRCRVLGVAACFLTSILDPRNAIIVHGYGLPLLFQGRGQQMQE